MDSPAIREFIKKRQQAWLNDDLPLYKVYRNKVIKLYKKARHKFYNDKIINIHESNPKKWWDGIKLLSGLSNPPPITSNAVNGTVLSDFDLAVAINESFCSVADDIPQSNFTPIPVPNIPEEFIITCDAVEAALLSVQNRKAIGPDEIPNWLLKTCATTISLPVCSMFNSSIREGHFPRLWKSADVLPLRKISRPKSIDTDLRPISLTAVLSKILESFVFNWLAPIVMQYIDPFQFGSVKKSSTTHALVHLVHYWLSALEIPNTIIRTCFINFSKAFDLIGHKILMHKLQLLNVPPVLINWCSSFLQKRQQRVTLRTCKSNWKEIKAGVPQGTKLGPSFFLIMVNDLSSELPLYKYVDDCSVSEVIRISELDESKLQQEIDNVTQWSSANNMKLNAKKTKDFTVSFLHS